MSRMPWGLAAEGRPLNLVRLVRISTECVLLRVDRGQRQQANTELDIVGHTLDDRCGNIRKRGPMMLTQVKSRQRGDRLALEISQRCGR